MSGTRFVSLTQFSSTWRGWIVPLVLLPAFMIASAAGQPADPVPSSRQLKAQWPDETRRKDAEVALQRKLKATKAQVSGIGTPELSSIRIPVLVPEGAFGLTSLSIRAIEGEDKYVATGTAPNLTLTVIGSALVHTPPPQSPTAHVFAEAKQPGITVTRTETGLIAGTTQYGIPYTIILECKNKGDRRCSDEAYVRSLAANLVMVGGQP